MTAGATFRLDDPEVFAHQYDPVGDRVLLVRLSPAAMRGASFLDQRVLTAGVPQKVVPYAEFSAEARAFGPALPAMIFHLGHCGSTLVSRLIGEAAEATVYREPLILRVLAAELAETASGDALLSPSALAERYHLFLKSCAKGRQATVVKATSICNGLARIDHAVAANSAREGRSIFVFIRSAIYLAALLGGENARTDLYGFAKLRRRRLADLARTGAWSPPPLSDLSIGEVAALSWLAETVEIDRAIRAGADLACIDFDAFLADPAPALAMLCDRTARPASGEAIARALAGPLMKRYSKAMEHDFSPGLRREIIADASRNHAAEIARGRAFLDRAAKADAAIAGALERFG